MYVETHGVIIIYDVGDKDSFDAVDNWVTELSKYTKDVVKMLVGAKCDKEKQKVTFTQGKKMADKHDMLFIETSAKASFNVDKLFKLLARRMKSEIDRKNADGFDI